MNYNFDIEVAKEYGVNEAIMIANFQFWIAKNKANGKNFHNGNYWTYNSAKAFAELFPFWSERQVRGILKSLIDKGVLKTSNFNESKYDRTLWYAFVDEEKWIYNKEKLHFTKKVNAISENVTPIPDNKPDNKPDNIYKPYEKEFEEFWKAYPKQRIGNKEKGYSSYVRVIKEKRASVEQLLKAVKDYSESEEVRKGFAKGCQAWLNDDRFNIEYKSKQLTVNLNF